MDEEVGYCRDGCEPEGTGFSLGCVIRAMTISNQRCFATGIPCIGGEAVTRGRFYTYKEKMIQTTNEKGSNIPTVLTKYVPHTVDLSAGVSRAK